MKYLSILLFIFNFSFLVTAQKPRHYVDINMEGRKENEVNEPGYTPWYINRVHSATLNISGIRYTLKATGPVSNTTFRTSWAKVLVQSPYYMRLVNDGVQIDNDILLANAGRGASMEMHISGLPVGKHTLQTYHNLWQDTSKTNYSPFNVYLGDSLLHKEIYRSSRAKSNSQATLLLSEFMVNTEGEEIILRFEAEESFASENEKPVSLNINLNAFILNAMDATRQARDPFPAHQNIHTDADSGYVILKWSNALKGGIKSHILYIGTDSSQVANALDSSSSCYAGEFPQQDTSYRINGLYSMNTYYWRVDEKDSTNEITEGNIWRFKPRQQAFYGAEGYGRYATGGRGGIVLEVNNLNDDGPGSLRDAITNYEGPRTIVFSVSGIIILNSRLVMKDKFITIAGQTAPGKGICIRKAPLGVGSESVTRFVRLRLGAGQTYDGMGMAGGNHSIIDHCSVSWTIDEAFSSRNANNITLQRTLISEALNVANHENYSSGSAHGFAASIGGDTASFHHNLLAHCNGRNWSLAGGLDGDGYYAGHLDIFNNVVYNWGTRTTDGGAHQVNFVNNYYKKGPASTNNYILTAQLEGLGKGSQSYYYSGNILQNTNGSFSCNGSNNTCARRTEISGNQIVNWQVFVDQPFFPSRASIESARDAYKSVLSDVGCTMPLQDQHDKRILRETLTGTYSYTGNKTGLPGLIDHQNDAGGYEEYPEYHRPDNFDSDHDGLPDWWENLFGSNPFSETGDFSDTNADPDKNGYTTLEDYLEWMAVPHFYLQKNVYDTIDFAKYAAGYTKPEFSCIPNPHFEISFLGSSMIIKPNTQSDTLAWLDIIITDKEGSVFIKRTGICVGIEDQISTSTAQSTSLNLCQKPFFSVFPSRFDSKLTIRSRLFTPCSLQLRLLDIRGKIILSKEIECQAGENTDFIFCPDSLPEQMYFLQILNIETKCILTTEKLIKI